MSIVHHSLRSKRCLAEDPNHQTAVASLHAWELHIGTVQLFICGPGPDAWLACSDPCYSGQIGTDHERAVARRALLILNREHLQNKDAGPEEIKQALARVVKTAARP